MARSRLENVFHSVTAGAFEIPPATEPFTGGDPFDDGGQDPEAEKRAHDALMACRDQLIEGWDPRVLGIGYVATRKED